MDLLAPAIVLGSSRDSPAKALEPFALVWNRPLPNPAANCAEDPSLAEDLQSKSGAGEGGAKRRMRADPRTPDCKMPCAMANQRSRLAEIMPQKIVARFQLHD
jgi:hypothetical protein